MLKFIALLALAVYQVSAGAVELLPTAQLAPVAPVGQALVTARSSQYFSQNFNALASPVVAPVAQYVAPSAATVSQVARYAAPVAQYVASPIAPVARYIAPTAAAYSQITRYASPVAQYIAPLSQYAFAPLVQANLAVAPAAQLVANAAPLVASPVVASTPLAVGSPQPVAVPQPISPQEPSGIPSGQGQNVDDEAIEIESARVRTLPQARNQPQRVAEPQQSAPAARFQTFSQQNVVARYQQQVAQQTAKNAGYSNGPAAQGRSQQQSAAESTVKNVGQQQQVVARSGALVAAPGLLSSQQYIQGLYFG